MSEILSREDWMKMRAGRHAGDTQILDRHDKALRAEVEALRRERDRALRRAQAESRANEAIRVAEEERDGAIAGQVMLDDKLTLMEHRALAAERRLAEVERIADEMGDGVSPECSGFADKIRAVLDKGEQDG